MMVDNAQKKLDKAQKAAEGKPKGSTPEEIIESRKKLEELAETAKSAEEELQKWQAIKEEVKKATEEKVEETLPEASATEPNAEETATEAASDPKPIGKGSFGNIYDQFKGKFKEAVAFLRGLKSGQAKAVFHRDGIGDI